MQYES
jgi:hypothetical protein